MRTKHTPHRNFQLPNKFRPPWLLRYTGRGGNRWMEWKTTWHRIWLNHPIGDFYSPVFLFFLSFHRFVELFAPVGIMYTGWGSNRCNRWGFFFGWAVPSFLLLPLLWLPVMLHRVLLIVLPLLDSIFYALCFSIRFARFPVSSVNTLSPRLLRCRDEQNKPPFEEGLIPSWRWDSRRTWPRRR